MMSRAWELGEVIGFSLADLLMACGITMLEAATSTALGRDRFPDPVLWASRYKRLFHLIVLRTGR